MIEQGQFLEQFEENKDIYYRIALSYLKNADDAMEAVCEMSLKAWEHRASLRKSSAFRTWTISILINCCRSAIRRKKYCIESDAEAQEMPAEDIAGRLVLRAAVDNLPEKYRDVIILRYYNSFDLNEIARTLHIPLGTVKSRLNRAHAVLKSRLEGF